MMCHPANPVKGHVFIGDAREPFSSRGAGLVNGGLAPDRFCEVRAIGPHPSVQHGLPPVVSRSPYGLKAHTLLGSRDWLVSSKMVSRWAYGLAGVAPHEYMRGRLNKTACIHFGRVCRRVWARKTRPLHTSCAFVYITRFVPDAITMICLRPFRFALDRF